MEKELVCEENAQIADYFLRTKMCWSGRALGSFLLCFKNERQDDGNENGKRKLVEVTAGVVKPKTLI